MKKLLTYSLALVLAAGAAAPAAYASESDDLRAKIRCGIERTGYFSDNSCEVDSEVVVECDIDNYVNIGNTVYQDGESGEVAIEYNTNAGDSLSGTVSNENYTNLEVVVENACAKDKEEDKEKEQPGNGAGAGEEKPSQPGQPGALAEQDVAKLPVTDGVSPAVIAVVVASVFGAVALVARLGVAAYARFKA